MRRQVPKRSAERGVALVVCMLIMAVLALLGAAMVTNSVIEIKTAGNQRSGKVDFYAADGGTRLLVPRLADPIDQVGAVANVDVANQILAPNATTDPVDPSLAGWSLAQAGLVPAWGGGQQPFTYNYRFIYLRKSNPPKGYSVGSFAGYFFEVDSLANSTGVDTINSKIGPK